MCWVFGTIKSVKCHHKLSCTSRGVPNGFLHNWLSAPHFECLKFYRPLALLFGTWSTVHNILFKVIFEYLNDVASIRTSSDSILSRLVITSFLFSWHPHAACELLRVHIFIVTWKLTVVNVNCTRLHNCPIWK